MRKTVLFLIALLLISSCVSQGIEEAPISLTDAQTTATIKKKQFRAYPGCTIEERTGAGLKIRVQNCKVKGKLLTVNVNEALPGYFIEIDSGSGFIAQELALQVFDIGDYPAITDGVKKLEELLKKESIIKESSCVLKKDSLRSTPQKEVFTLSSEKLVTNCGEYSDSKEKQKYFIFYNTSKKVVFVNQFKAKKLYDESSIEFIK